MKKALTIGALALSSLMPLKGENNAEKINANLESITEYKDQVANDLGVYDSLTNQVNNIITKSSDSTLTYLGVSDKDQRMHQIRPLVETSLAQVARDLGIVESEIIEEFSYGALSFKLKNEAEQVKFGDFSFAYNIANKKQDATTLTDIRYKAKSVSFSPNDTIVVVPSEDPIFFGGNVDGIRLLANMNSLSKLNVDKESLDSMNSYFNDIVYKWDAIKSNSDSLSSLDLDAILSSASDVFSDEEAKKIVNLARDINQYTIIDSAIATAVPDSSYDSLDSLFHETVVADTSMNKYTAFVKKFLGKNKVKRKKEDSVSVVDSSTVKNKNQDWSLGIQRINDPGVGYKDWVGNGNGLMVGRRFGPVWLEYSFSNSKNNIENLTETVNDEGLGFTNYGTKNISSQLSNNFHMVSLGIPVKNWKLILGAGLENKLVEETTKVYEEIKRNEIVLATNSDSYIENSEEQNNILNLGIGRRIGTYEVNGNILVNLDNPETENMTYAVSLSKLLRGKK